jgi:hypothetical protein
MGIVKMSLVIIMQYFVGLADSLEFEFCSLPLVFWYLVWMMLKCCLEMYFVSLVS